LKIAFKAGIKDGQLGFAVRKDWSILASLIDKVMTSIPVPVHQKILNKWVSQVPATFDDNLSVEDIIGTVYQFIVVALLILLIIVLARKWHQTLQLKIMVYVVLPVFFVLTLILSYSNWKNEQLISAKIKSQVTELSHQYARYIDVQLEKITQVATTTADILSTAHFSEQNLYQLLQKNVSGNRFIYGAAIAFEPNIYSNYRRFSPYVYRKDAGLDSINIANSYDYLSFEWYAAVRETHHSRWSEPYFDDGAGNAYMVTFSAPIKRDGQFI